jgi:hypothetical protein
LRALATATLASGLDDKEIYDPLGIDHAQWSRITTGKANFPMSKYEQFAQLVGNDVLLKWIAHRRGYELKPIASDLERENARLRAEVERRDREYEVLVRFLKETRA